MWPVVLCTALALGAGCEGGSSSERDSAGGRPCPVTRPNGSVPPQRGDLRGSDTRIFHGNGAIWTRFRTEHGVRATDAFVGESGIEAEWPWWRGVEGQLRIEGRRIDGGDVRLRAEVPAGYGLTGFQPSTLVFPLEGCWRVTGRVGEASLTFVMLVRYTDRSP